MKSYVLLFLTILFVLLVSCNSEPEAMQQLDATDNVGVIQQPSDGMERLARLPSPPMPGREVVDGSGAIIGGEAMGSGGAAGGYLVGQATGTTPLSPCDLFFTLDVSDPDCNTGAGYIANFHVQAPAQPWTNLSLPLNNNFLSSTITPRIVDLMFNIPLLSTWVQYPSGYPTETLYFPYHPEQDTVYKMNGVKIYDQVPLQDSSGYPYGANYIETFRAPISEIKVFPTAAASSDIGARNLIRPTLDLSEHGKNYYVYLYRYGYVYNENLPNPNPGVVGNWERFEWYWPNNDPGSTDYDTVKYPLATQFDDKSGTENWLPLTLNPELQAAMQPTSFPPIGVTKTSPTGVQYFVTPFKNGVMHPKNVNLAITDSQLSFDYSDTVLGQKRGSVIAFACVCQPYDQSFGAETCSNQNLWECNNRTVGQLGVENGRWMLKDFLANEAQVSAAPPDPTN